MQISNKVWFIVKLVMLFAILWYVWIRLKDEQANLDSILSQMQQLLHRERFAGLSVVVLLIVVNWSLEAKKWQLLAHRIEQISFVQAIKSVLAGLSLGFLAPAFLGDATAKVLSLQSEQRTKSLGAVVLGGGIQFYVALCFGTIAYFYFLIGVKEVVPLSEWILSILLIISILLGLWLFIKRTNLSQLFLKKWLSTYGHFFQVLGEYSQKELIAITQMAVIRYLTFSLQFLLILQIFAISLPILDLTAVVFLVFFAKTVIPAFNFLSDLGVREFSALYFFQYFHVPSAQVVSATLSLWLLNILLPVLVGSVLVLQLKVSKV